MSSPDGEPVKKSKSKKDKKASEKNRISWLARGTSRDERHYRKSINASGEPAGASGQGKEGSAPTTPEPNRKWHKGDVMSPEVLARQRTLEQFLLKFEMKHLRGTNWKFYDISTTPEDDISLAGVQPSPDPASLLSSSAASSSSSALGVMLAPPPFAAPPPPSQEIAIPEASPKPRRPQHNLSSSISASTGALDGHQENAKEAIILIPPGGVRPEAMFEHIIGFASRGFRVIAPRVPEMLEEFEDYSAGILLIMREAKMGRAHFLGLGMGGMIVQHILYRFPERVLTASLAHTAPPDEELMARVEKALANKTFSAEVLANYLLGFKIKEKDLDGDMPKIKGDEKTLWLVFMKQFQTSKQTVASYTQALLNYHRDIAYIPGDFKRFKGDLFLIESQLPQYAVALEEQRALFPNATLYLYPNKGPLYSLVRGNKTAQRVVEFIRQSRAIRKRKKAEKEKQSLLSGTPTTPEPDPLKLPGSSSRRKHQ
ncbi:MAG: alpha/beta hydrolase [archaeon]|nr:alpha/beta hydrolase [archaeon]